MVSKGGAVMPKFLVTGPDGQNYEVNGPEGSTEQQAIEYVKSGMGLQPMKVPGTPKRPEWADMPGNVLPSAGRFVGGLAQTVAHPIDTLNGVLNLGAGALRNVTPESIRNFIDRFDPNPAQTQRDTALADAVGQHYKQRYGGLENIRNTVITDPVGFAADASAVTGLGGAALKAAMPRTAGVLGTISEATNPINMAVEGTKAVSNAVAPIAGSAIRHVQAGLTGISPESFSRPFSAGKAGPRFDPTYINNLKGAASPEEILNDARSSLQSMKSSKGMEYRAGMAPIAQDTRQLPFNTIDAKLTEIIDSVHHTTPSGKKVPLVSEAEMATIDKVKSLVQQWRIDAELQTPSGLDALKKTLDNVYPDSPKYAQAQRAVTAVRNAVKETIVKNVPEYADTMKAYEQANALEQEITKALSIGTKASHDTAIRKLLSLSRSNVNTNFGHRVGLAETLDKAGGSNIMDAVAGQAQSRWLPSGIQRGTLPIVGTLGFMGGGPAGAVAATAMQSPKLNGLLNYGAGRATGSLMRAGAMVPPWAQETAPQIGLGAAQLGLLDPLFQ
jgi:hypothetical protein